MFAVFDFETGFLSIVLAVLELFSEHRSGLKDPTASATRVLVPEAYATTTKLIFFLLKSDKSHQG